MANIIIIGRGPAGISASLYTARAGIETTIIGKDTGSLGKAHAIENYYGFGEPITGEQLALNGIAGAQRLGVTMIQEEVMGISFEDTLVVSTKEGDYPANGVIIATGNSHTTPAIKGLKELEGHGVSYCAICDGFFYRGKEVAVLGDSDYAIHEALQLLPLVSKLTLLTNGKELQVELPEGIHLDTRPIQSILGETHVEGVGFETGNPLEIAGIFIAIGVAGSTALAKKIGALTDNNKILVDENMATNIPGLYAAGDCTGGLLQVSKAVYQGALAGTQLIKYLKSVQ